MTRGMFVTVLGRMADAKGDGAAAAKAFADVAADAYYAPYVAWASENGIVTGTDPGRFEPEATGTREQMAAILARYIGKSGLELAGKGDKAAFADDGSISAYAKDAVYEMRGTGVISGKPGNRFDPQGVAVRAEVAALMQQFAQASGKAA